MGEILGIGCTHTAARAKAELLAGQHEFLNWICLAGAMEGRKPRLLLLSESYLFNSNRMVVVFPV